VLDAFHDSDGLDRTVNVAEALAAMIALNRTLLDQATAIAKAREGIEAINVRQIGDCRAYRAGAGWAKGKALAILAQIDAPARADEGVKRDDCFDCDQGPCFMNCGPVKP
jgi:hypothetical protein